MRGAFTIVLLAATHASAVAHHSISAAYDPGTEVRIEATVTRFAFVNPHPFVIVESESEDGSRDQWRLELDNRSELARIGMTADTIEAGDRIEVRGNPSRTEQRSLYVRRLDHPADGFSYEQVGSRPRIRSGR
jgi:hypothetical protein